MADLASIDDEDGEEAEVVEPPCYPRSHREGERPKIPARAIFLQPSTIQKRWGSFHVEDRRLDLKGRKELEAGLQARVR